MGLWDKLAIAFSEFDKKLTKTLTNPDGRRVRLNIGKRGIGFSVEKDGVRIGIGSTGRWSISTLHGKRWLNLTNQTTKSSSFKAPRRKKLW